jgi:phosphatidylglycerol:prolipoprotein diacylglycerol transferase
MMFRVMMSELGHLGPITIRTYTLLLDAALLVGLGALAWRGWKIAEAPARWIDAGLGAIVGGLVLARLGHVAVHWTYFSEHQDEIAQVWKGGLNWHGAIVGGLIGLAAVGAWRGVPFRRAGDALALVLPLGAALTWAGCLASTCGHGREVRSLADYPTPLVGELPDLYGVVAPRLASQLYGVAFGLALFGVGLVLARIVRGSGVRLWIILALLGLGTFAIGFTRGDLVPTVGTLRLDQVLDLGIVALGVIGTIAAAWPIRSEQASEGENAD